MTRRETRILKILLGPRLREDDFVDSDMETEPG